MKPQTAMMGKLATVEPVAYGDGKTLAKCALQSGEDRIPFTVFGRLVDDAQRFDGRRVIVEADLSGRQYNEKLYLECVARNIYLSAQETGRDTAPAPATPAAAPRPTPQPTPRMQEPEPMDDIPF